MISIYGAGYVGLVSAVCFAKLGHHVICADVDAAKIAQLAAGICPIYEADLPELLQQQLHEKRLHFTADLSFAIQQSEVHLIATGTPSLPNGNADLSQVFSVARQVARETTKDVLIVTKSTVPVGTGEAIEAIVEETLNERGKTYCIEIASNPEFLREGSAVYDFMYADRIVLGGSEKAHQILKFIYQPLINKGIPLLCMSRHSAELTKYASNAMLACKISFINQISQLAEKVDADIDEIRLGMGSDKRIGPHFLQAGIGYGGSCFPKDVRALMHTSKVLGIDSTLLDAIETINKEQKNWVIERLNQHFFNKLQGLTIGLWGLAFKPGTNDLREASSIYIIRSLLSLGVRLRVFDPVAMPEARVIFPNEPLISWCNSADETLRGQINALVIATEWAVFKQFSLNRLAEELGDAPIIDGRNCFKLAEVRAAKISYYSVGRPTLLQKATCLA